MAKHYNLNAHFGLNLSISLIFSLIFTLILSTTVVYLEVTNQLKHLNDYKIETIQIEDKEDFFNLSHTQANSNYLLTDDITFSSSDLEKINAFDLNGNFNGQGHTLEFNGIDKSIFNSISKNSTIENLKVEIKGVNLNDSKLSGITLNNYGTIKNCLVEFEENFSTLSTYNLGGIAINNQGEINQCFVYIKVDENISNLSSYSFGGIVTNNLNEGQIKNCAVISISKFLSENSADYIFTHSPSYIDFGYVYSFNYNQDGINNVFALKECLYSNDEFDENISYVELDKFYDSDLYINDLGFSSAQWIIKDGELPRLRGNTL